MLLWPLNTMPAESTRNLENLLEASRLLSSTLDLPELLRAIVSLGARMVEAETASLLLLDPETDELYFDVALGVDPKLAKLRLRLGQGIAGAVARDNRAVIVQDARADKRWSPSLDAGSGFVTRSLLAVPLSLKGRCLGVLEAVNKTGGPFKDEDRAALEAFASQAAVALENARLFSSLKEERATLDTLLNEMRDAALLVDEDGSVLACNRAARGYLPRDKARLDEAFAGMSCAPEPAALLGASPAPAGFEAVREKPKKLVLAGTSTLVRSRDRQGKAHRVIVFRDVTEERHEAGLERNFLSLISHKLKTPLVSINGFSQVLLEDAAAKGLPDLYLRSLRTILAQGQKLALLVEKLVNYTLLDGLADSPVSLAEIRVEKELRDALASMRPWLEEHGGEVSFECAPDLALRTDVGLFKDAVKNLVENGVKFNGAARKNVAVRAAAAGEWIEVLVRDEGVGVPPEERERIFKRFHQVESAFTGQVDGWGLGLSFVDQVARRLGGSARLDSSAAAGSTFALRLPRKGP
ncbi:MAG TPA: GAF domain-containing sensor histidine kinase [Elusimicrobiota bacterium]|nr:GAF domain-containing sensor histidine kinase [Elusimicrobiota bacterium]